MEPTPTLPFHPTESIQVSFFGHSLRGRTVIISNRAGVTLFPKQPQPRSLCFNCRVALDKGQLAFVHETDSLPGW